MIRPRDFYIDFKEDAPTETLERLDAAKNDCLQSIRYDKQTLEIIQEVRNLILKTSYAQTN